MNPKKDRLHLHVTIKPITAEKIKDWSEDLGYTYGEMIDNVVELYERFCNQQYEYLEQMRINDTLKLLIEKVDALSDRIK